MGNRREKELRVPPKKRKQVPRCDCGVLIVLAENEDALYDVRRLVPSCSPKRAVLLGGKIRTDKCRVYWCAGEEGWGYKGWVRCTEWARTYNFFEKGQVWKKERKMERENKTSS